MKNYLICLIGPTAVGKTAVSLDLAVELQIFFGQKNCIVSADSRQVYQEIPVGTAQLSFKDQRSVPHYFMGDLSIAETFNAGIFEQKAREILSKHYQNHKLALLVGGSGLYVDALCKGFSFFPDVSEFYREEVIRFYQDKGLSALQQEVQRLDPSYAERVDMQNPQRLMRALEICWSTGRTFSSFLDQPRQHSLNLDFEIIYIGLHLEKSDLVSNIQKRTKEMLAQGLIEEAEKMLPYKHHNALQTVGYPETFAYLENLINLETLEQQIALKTAQYAKRQMTWFRKNKAIQWFFPQQKKEIFEFILGRMKV